MVTATDPEGASASVTVDPGAGIVAPVNQAPVVDESKVAVGAPDAEHGLVAGNVTDVFTDPEGGDLTYSIGSEWTDSGETFFGVPVFENAATGEKLAFRGTDGIFVYAPGTDGQYTPFVVTATDPEGASASVTVDPGAGIVPTINYEVDPTIEGNTLTLVSTDGGAPISVSLPGDYDDSGSFSGHFGEDDRYYYVTTTVSGASAFHAANFLSDQDVETPAAGTWVTVVDLHTGEVDHVHLNAQHGDEPRVLTSRNGQHFAVAGIHPGGSQAWMDGSVVELPAGTRGVNAIGDSGNLYGLAEGEPVTGVTYDGDDRLITVSSTPYAFSIAGPDSDVERVYEGELAGVLRIDPDSNMTYDWLDYVMPVVIGDSSDGRVLILQHLSVSAGSDSIEAMNSRITRIVVGADGSQVPGTDIELYDGPSAGGLYAADETTSIAAAVLSTETDGNDGITTSTVRVVDLMSGEYADYIVTGEVTSLSFDEPGYVTAHRADNSSQNLPIPTAPEVNA
ncbi:hypothetical protein GCM10022231_07050 [Gordonia caeni]|uniref:RapA2 cadherin-like domain-containing protein n=1 Tax=Gordonia caeni TaxID=1007097 RepID=A0ABP7NQ12_9ACTN